MTKKIAGIEVTNPKEAHPHYSILIYGMSGVGKTVVAGSASEVEELSPVLIIDVEGGMLSLRDFYPDVDVVRVKSWAEMQKLLQSLRKSEVADYSTIVIDSLSELQKFSMNEIMRKVVQDDPDRDPDVPSMREWGKNLEQMRRTVRLFRDLPVHTIFTAHSQEETYGRAERTRTKVSLTGKLANEIAGFMDLVLFMYMKQRGKEEKRYLLTGQREDVIAKDRTNKLPLVVEEPTLRAVFEAIRSSETSVNPEDVLEQASKSTK